MTADEGCRMLWEASEWQFSVIENAFTCTGRREIYCPVNYLNDFSIKKLFGGGLSSRVMQFVINPPIMHITLSIVHSTPHQSTGRTVCSCWWPPWRQRDKQLSILSLLPFWQCIQLKRKMKNRARRRWNIWAIKHPRSPLFKHRRFFNLIVKREEKVCSVIVLSFHSSFSFRSVKVAFNLLPFYRHSLW